MKKTIVALTFMLLQSSYAGVFKCTAADAKPDMIEGQEKLIDVTIKNPSMVDYAFDPRNNVDTKTPFLMFYAIDSAEPFMEYTIKYEMAEMKRSCRNSKNVNFVAFLNSDYVNKNEFVICKNQKFQRINFSSYPALDELLKKKREFIRTGDHFTANKGMMRYLVRYHKNNNEAFGQFPLAHPDFLYDLQMLITTNAELFPSDKYHQFLNLKSHGNKKNVLSGLHPCQTMGKTASQMNLIEKLLSPEEIKLLEEASYDEKLEEVIPVLNKLGLGNLVGFEKSETENPGKNILGKNNLGKFNLGKSNLGQYFLGEAAAGLGADSGLGAEFTFGLPHSALTTVLAQTTNADNRHMIGFVMLESCESNRNTAFHHQLLEGVLGIYSADHSLWYRNLNWWELMEKSEGVSSRLQKLVADEMMNVGNLVME